MNDTKTVSGAIVHITDADEAPLVRCLVDIEPKQSGSGTPSPDNVRPISGWSSVNLYKSGKNLFGGEAFADGIKTAIPQAVLDAEAKTISYLSGYATEGSNFTSGLPFKANTQYTIILKFSNTKARTNVSVVYTDGTNQYIPTSVTGLQTAVFTTAANKTIDYIGGKNSDGASVFYYEECGVFEGVLTADQFEPYTGTTKTVNLGRTVYGGTLDVVSGVLTVDRAMVTINGSSNFTQKRAGTSNSLFGLDLASGQGSKAVAETALPNVIANELPLETAYNAWRNEAPLVAVTSTGNTIWFRLPSITALADAKTYLNSNPLQVCYELATPQTYTLTGQEVSAMYGENYIWASSGPVEITYRTNVPGIYNKIYIDGRPYFRPNDFEIKREDVYAGEYTTCTGKLIADKIGWKYSDLPMKWDILPDEDLVYLTTLTGAFNLIFRDSDGQHTETVIRKGFTNTPTRITGPEGSKIWTGIEMEVTFLNTHPIDEE